jgi:tetratricopeptide (TPR) repeat protein
MYHLIIKFLFFLFIQIELLKRKAKAVEENNIEAQADACNKLGNYFMNANQLDNALTQFKEESSIHKKLNRKIDFAKANRLIGEVYMSMGRYKDALTHEDVYLKTAKRENDLVEVQRAYATIGRCYLMRGEDCENDKSNGTTTCSTKIDVIEEDYKAAERAFLKSLIICKE